MKALTLFFSAALTTGLLTTKAQDVLDTRVVGIVAFSSGSTQDSLAAKDVNATAARVLVQTQRFTILDVSEWKKTQQEIDRQKDAAFMERDIIQKGKSLGAKVLVIGTVKNAEIYKDNEHYAARVDYEIKFVDVESNKSIAASSFTGDSETFANMGSKASKALGKIVAPSYFTGKGNWKALALTSGALAGMSEVDKNTVMGKLIDAIEHTAPSLNAWIRGTFGINLLCLAVSDQDNKKGFQHVLIEGGNNINMSKGDELTLVIINQMETARGKIQDEATVASLEVEEVRAQTSQCKVTSGGKNISADKDQISKYRVVFKQKK